MEIIVKQKKILLFFIAKMIFLINKFFWALFLAAVYLSFEIFTHGQNFKVKQAVKLLNQNHVMKFLLVMLNMYLSPALLCFIQSG